MQQWGSPQLIAVFKAMTCNSTLSACAAVALWRWSLELYRCLQSHVVWWNPLVFTEESSKMLEEWKFSSKFDKFHLKLAPPKKNGRLYLAIWGSLSPTVAWNEFEDMLICLIFVEMLSVEIQHRTQLGDATPKHASEGVTGSAVLSACQRSRRWMTSVRSFFLQMSF